MPAFRLPEPLAAVVFDMDGLLLDTEVIYRQAIFDACAGLGFTMTDALHLSLIGSPKEASDQKLLAGFGSDFPLSEYHLQFRIGYEKLCLDGVPVKPGAKELLIYLQAARIPRAVATSTHRKMAEEHLVRAGLRPWLDSVITRDDVTHGKPNPESFLKAATALGASPRNCLALEDSHNGIRAAAAAGMATVMVPDLLPATPEMHGLCIGIVDTLDQVLSHIRNGR